VRIGDLPLQRWWRRDGGGPVTANSIRCAVRTGEERREARNVGVGRRKKSRISSQKSEEEQENKDIDLSGTVEYA
jgi:hypothetical protein